MTRRNAENPVEADHEDGKLMAIAALGLGNDDKAYVESIVIHDAPPSALPNRTNDAGRLSEVPLRYGAIA
jgi:hypothetical protein